MQEIKERLQRYLSTMNMATVNIDTSRTRYSRYLSNKITEQPVAEALLFKYDRIDTSTKELNIYELKQIIIEIIAISTPMQKLSILLNLIEHIYLSTSNPYRNYYDIFKELQNTKNDVVLSTKIALDIFAIAYLGLWRLDDDSKSISTSLGYEREDSAFDDGKTNPKQN